MAQPEKTGPAPSDSIQISYEDEKKPPLDIYHVFNRRDKIFLVLLVSIVGSFSPLSNNIYLPALNDIAQDIHVTPEAVALSVTSFMVAQALTPSIFGPLADVVGRRQVILYTLMLFVISNIGLAITSRIEAIIFFRFIQAAGCASAGSIGAGIIADIAPAKERGGYMGAFGGLRQFSLAIGPVFGGILSGTLGYVSIFWSLLIVSSIGMIMMILLLPETLRSIAGNGNKPLKGWKFTPLYHKRAPWVKAEALGIPLSTGNEVERVVMGNITLRMFFEPLLFLLEKDVLCTLLHGAVIFSVWSMVTESTSSVLVHAYDLSTLEVGLCFLPNGIGCALGSIIAGKQLDKDFRSAEVSYKYRQNLPQSYVLPKASLPNDFPIERARLGQLPSMTTIVAFSVVLYGFSVPSPGAAGQGGQGGSGGGGGRGSLVVPLMAQFAIGYSSTAVLNLNNMLMVDLYPGNSASATAVNNLARYMVGAAGVSFTEMALKALRPDSLFLILGAVVIAASPMAWAEWTFGMKWREQRRIRVATREGLKHIEAQKTGL